MTRKALLAIAVSTLLAAGNAQAIIYQVGNAATNCGSAPHGLWTGSDDMSGQSPSQSCFANYAVESGTFAINADANDPGGYTAELDLQVRNPHNVVAIVDLHLFNFNDVYDPYKREGGRAYDAQNDPNDGSPATIADGDIDFFAGLSGDITFYIDDGQQLLFQEVVNFTDYEFDSRGTYAFQFGTGANAKSATAFGGSAWIKPIGKQSSHWDLNLTFNAPTTPPNQTPEPGTLALFALALIAATRMQLRREKSRVKG